MIIIINCNIQILKKIHLKWGTRHCHGHDGADFGTHNMCEVKQYETDLSQKSMKQIYNNIVNLMSEFWRTDCYSKKFQTEIVLMVTK